MTFLRISCTPKLFGASVAALAAGATIAATPARADPGLVIAGAIGAAALAAVVAGAANAHPQPNYFGYAEPTYVPPAPVYAGPGFDPSEGYAVPDRHARYDSAADAPVYEDDQPICQIRNRPVRDEWGRVVAWRPARVCR